MEHALGLTTNLALLIVCTVVIIALSISEARATKRKIRPRLREIKNQQVA
jgi:hypothetical protein